VLREHDLRDVDARGRDGGRTPDDEHGDEVTRADDEGEPVAQVAPVSLRQRLVRPQRVRGNARDEQCGEEERDRVGGVRDVDPVRGEQQPRDRRSDGPCGVLDRREQ
jgi:hypothetical protein